MRIKEIKSQNRRDFYAVYECEHCGHLNQGSGYDDAHFHQKVIPAMACPVCAKTAGESYRPLTTKHAEGTQLRNCVIKAQTAAAQLMGGERKDRIVDALNDLSEALNNATE